MKFIKSFWSMIYHHKANYIFHTNINYIELFQEIMLFYSLHYFLNLYSIVIMTESMMNLSNRLRFLYQNWSYSFARDVVSRICEAYFLRICPEMLLSLTTDEIVTMIINCSSKLISFRSVMQISNRTRDNFQIIQNLRDFPMSSVTLDKKIADYWSSDRTSRVPSTSLQIRVISNHNRRIVIEIMKR